MSDPDGPEDLTPAEQALGRHLELLRFDSPAVPATLDQRILRRAKWQRAVRRPLQAVGHLAAALRDGLRLLITPTRGS